MGPPIEVGPRPGHHSTAEGTDTNIKATTKSNVDITNFTSSAAVSSRSVDAFSVCEAVAPLLDSVGTWPMLGTAKWRALPPGSPAWLAALFDGARHHAYRVQIGQEAMRDASQAISAAADWCAVSREILGLQEFRATHPEARRVVA